MMGGTEARPRRHDAAELKQLARGRWPEILSRLGGIEETLLDGRKHPCPKCGGKDRFRFVDRDAGALFCNQCFSKKNGDGLAALQWANGWGFGETCRKLAEYLGLSNGDHRSNGKPKQVFPTIDAALTAYDERIDGQRVGQWSYHDAAGDVVLVVARWDLGVGAKTIRPVSKQAGVWIHGDPPKPWPLYNLAEVAKADVVHFVEGEKCVEAARSIGIVATTTAHGCQSPQHTGQSHHNMRVLRPLAD